MSTEQKPASENGSPMGSETWRRHDPLLSSLIEVARFHGRGMTPEGFLSGLPLLDGRLTPSVFRRAAARAGLASRISKRPLAAIRDELLPVILLLKDNDSCVLMGWNESRTLVRVLFSEAGQGIAEVTVDHLESLYSGHTIFVRPRFRFDTRAPEIRDVVNRHWFFGALLDNVKLYRDVLAAAFLINLFAIVIPFYTLNIYDRVVPNNATETLWTLSIGVLIVTAADFGMRMLRGYVLDMAGKRVDVQLSALIMERVLGMQMANRPASAGSFAANLRAFESVRDFITSTTVTAFIDLPFALIFIVLILWLGWPMAIPLLLGITGLVLYALMLQPKMQELTETTYRATATRNSTLIESLVGIETIKTQCAEGAMQRKWEQSVGFLAKVGADLRYLSLSVVNSSAAVQQADHGYLMVAGVYLRLLLPFMGVIAVYFFMRGHNLPGGGFVAGLIFAVAILVQYMLAGTAWVESHVHLRPHRWLGVGLLLSCATGLGAWVFGHPFLTTHTAHVYWPLVGELHLPSAFVFDLGVFAVVVGTTMLMLVALAHQSLRAHRHPGEELSADGPGGADGRRG